jgi:hypothetical protein
MLDSYMFETIPIREALKIIKESGYRLWGVDTGMAIPGD